MSRIRSSVVYTTTRTQSFAVTPDVTASRITSTKRERGKEPLVNVVERLSTTLVGEDFKLSAVLWTEAFKETLRTLGWTDAVYQEIQNCTDPYTRLLHGQATLDDVVLVNTSSQMIFDVQNRPLPLAVHFDYINGQMDNERYDLRKALAILKTREDIRFVQHNRWENADGIQTIPGYNQSDGRTTFISFVWMPSVAEYRRVWDACLKLKEKYPSTAIHRMIHHLDILGLRAGGATRFKSFFGTCETDDEVEDE